MNLRWALSFIAEDLESKREFAAFAEEDSELIAALDILIEAAQPKGRCVMCDYHPDVSPMPQSLSHMHLCEKHHGQYEAWVAVSWFFERLHEQTRERVSCKSCRWSDGNYCFVSGETERASYPCRRWELYTTAPCVRKRRTGVRVLPVIWREEE